MQSHPPGKSICSDQLRLVTPQITLTMPFCHPVLNEVRLSLSSTLAHPGVGCEVSQERGRPDWTRGDSVCPASDGVPGLHAALQRLL